jgi:hypothetical protein
MSFDICMTFATDCVVDLRLCEHIEGIEQPLRVLSLKAKYLFPGREFDCDLPGIESGHDNIGVSVVAELISSRARIWPGNGLPKNFNSHHLPVAPR